jgi:hypothetical protein
MLHLFIYWCVYGFGLGFASDCLERLSHPTSKPCSG